MKSLIAYFSCSGVTKQVAEQIALVVHGDLHEIQPEIAYSDQDLNWHDQYARSTIEMKDHSNRVAIGNHVTNMDEYDTIFIGFPIWWYIAPTIINTFLEQYSFDNKTIIPFATSGGSGVGETDKYLQSSVSNQARLCPTTMLNGVITSDEILHWVEDMVKK